MSYQKTKFWAYLHQNGSVIVKQWFGDVKDYTEDCEGNDFVLQVVRPYEAENAEDARRIAMAILGFST